MATKFFKLYVRPIRIKQKSMLLWLIPILLADNCGPGKHKPNKPNVSLPDQPDTNLGPDQALASSAQNAIAAHPKAEMEPTTVDEDREETNKRPQPTVDEPIETEEKGLTDLPNAPLQEDNDAPNDTPNDAPNKEKKKKSWFSFFRLPKKKPKDPSN